MIIYIFILLLVSGYAFLIEKAIGRKAFIFPLMVLVIFAGLRDTSIGTDSSVYTAPFRQKLSSSSYLINSNIEIGYQYLVKFILFFTHNYAIYFFTVAFIVVYLNLRTLKKYSINYSFSLYLYISLGFYTALFNPIRQFLAMAIISVALPYLLNKKIYYYLMIVLLASFFHISALIFVPMYFLINSNLRLIYKAMFCLILSTLLSKIVILYLAQDNDRYANYTTSYTENGNGYLTIIFYLILTIFICFFGKSGRSDVLYNKSEQLLVCGMALTVPIVFLGTDPSGPLRIVNYFIWFFILLLPYIFKRFNYIISLLFVVLMFIYYLLIIKQFGNIYPYKLNPLFEIF